MNNPHAAKHGQAHSKATLSTSKKEFLGIKQVVFQGFQTKESFLQQKAGCESNGTKHKNLLI